MIKTRVHNIKSKGECRTADKLWLVFWREYILANFITFIGTPLENRCGPVYYIAILFLAPSAHTLGDKQTWLLITDSNDKSLPK